MRLFLITKHLRNERKLGLITAEVDHECFQKFGKNLKDDDDISNLFFRNNGKMQRNASEKFKTIFLSLVW